jgi:hypothetical protein
VVFLDVGVERGIGPGDVFAIYRPRNPVTNEAGAVFSLEPERLGEAVVIRVTERTATAILTASQKESRVGDQVVLSGQITP